MYTKPDSVLGKNLLDFVKAMEKDFADHPAAVVTQRARADRSGRANWRIRRG